MHKRCCGRVYWSPTARIGSVKMRRRISTRERVDIFHRNDGKCHLCGLRIDAGQAWEVSHDTPLQMGGADEGGNLKPAHAKCHRIHTASVDLPQIAKAKRREAAFRGAKAPSRNPLPAGKKSPWRKKLNGQVVPR